MTMITEKVGKYRTIYQYNKSSVGVCLTCYNGQDIRYSIVGYDRDYKRWRCLERDLTTSEAQSVSKALAAALQASLETVPC